jgi:hypothetical protein
VKPPYDIEKAARRVQMEIDRILLRGEPKDWMTVRGYVRRGEGPDKDFLVREVPVNPRVDMEAGTVQLILADGSRALELNQREAKKLLGLLQGFCFPKEPDPRQQELVRNVEGEEVALTSCGSTKPLIDEDMGNQEEEEEEEENMKEYLKILQQEEGGQEALAAAREALAAEAVEPTHRRLAMRTVRLLMARKMFISRKG